MDYNATGVIYPEVADEIHRVLLQGGNPSSVHSIGRVAKKEIENARMKIAGVVNCRARDIIFTGGGTEANNLALKGLTGLAHVFLSPIEHDSVLAATADLSIPTSLLSVDMDGRVDQKDLADKLASTLAEGDGFLVTVMMANNETGVLQDIAAIAEIVHAAGGLLHVDAIQAFGKVAIDFVALGADLLTLSAHKTGGPQGVGALILKPTIPLAAQIKGGGQELGRRSGTENIAGIAGFGMAAEQVGKSLARMEELRTIRDDIEAAILSICPSAPIYGRGADRLPNTLNVGMPGVQGETQVMHMDISGIAISSGSACSSGKVKESHVLKAMAVSGHAAREAIRVSLGWKNTAADAARFIAAWQALYERAGRKA